MHLTPEQHKLCDKYEYLFNHELESFVMNFMGPLLREERNYGAEKSRLERPTRESMCVNGRLAVMQMLKSPLVAVDCAYKDESDCWGKFVPVSLFKALKDQGRCNFFLKAEHASMMNRMLRNDRNELYAKDNCINWAVTENTQTGLVFRTGTIHSVDFLENSFRIGRGARSTKHSTFELVQCGTILEK